MAMITRLAPVTRSTAPLSFPKIISGHIDDAARRELEWRRRCRSAARLVLMAHPFAKPGAGVPDCGVRRKDLPQVRLSKDNELIQAFAAKRANQTFGNSVLPGRPGTDRPVADTHRSDPSKEDFSVGLVIVADQTFPFSRSLKELFIGVFPPRPKRPSASLAPLH